MGVTAMGADDAVEEGVSPGKNSDLSDKLDGSAVVRDVIRECVHMLLKINTMLAPFHNNQLPTLQ